MRRSPVIISGQCLACRPALQPHPRFRDGVAAYVVRRSAAVPPKNPVEDTP